MGAGAGLHADQTPGPAFEERKELAPPELAAHQGLAALIDTVNLNDILGEINADDNVQNLSQICR